MVSRGLQYSCILMQLIIFLLLGRRKTSLICKNSIPSNLTPYAHIFHLYICFLFPSESQKPQHHTIQSQFNIIILEPLSQFYQRNGVLQTTLQRLQLPSCLRVAADTRLSLQSLHSKLWLIHMLPTECDAGLIQQLREQIRDTQELRL